MSAKNAERKIIYLVAGLFFLIYFSSLCYGETDFLRILSTRDKGEVNKIIDEAEKVIEKNPKDKDTLKTLGIAYHNLGDLGVRTAPKMSVKYLERAHKLYPDDAEILVVLGSSTTMLGRYSKKKATEGRILVNKGANMIDRAVMSSPDDVLVRMMRANNSQGLPDFFGRRHFFKEDLLYIEKLINKSPSGFDKDFIAEVYYNLGTVYKSEGHDSSAKSYFKKAVEVSPDSTSGKEAQKKL